MLENPFLARPANPLAKVLLFCLPYAGAGASRYFRWTSYAPSSLDICPILLPGRESRIWEDPYTDLSALVRDLGGTLAASIDRPFAFFGHSMGALIAFELARHLRDHFGFEPLHLFASAARAPHLPDNDSSLHGLPDAELIARLEFLNHIPREILQHGDFLQVVLPTVRADFQLCETNVYRNEPPFAFPITVFGGSEDARVTGPDLEAWSRHTTGEFARHIFPGGHLFLHACESLMVQTLTAELDRTFSRRIIE